MSNSTEGLWPRVTHAIAAILHEVLPASRQELEERYLNEAKDLYDLEYRIRELDRGMTMHPRFAGDHAVH